MSTNQFWSITTARSLYTSSKAGLSLRWVKTTLRQPLELFLKMKFQFLSHSRNRFMRYRASGLWSSWKFPTFEASWRIFRRIFRSTGEGNRNIWRWWKRSLRWRRRRTSSRSITKSSTRRSAKCFPISNRRSTCCTTSPERTRGSGE